jgi:hypothetical protein
MKLIKTRKSVVTEINKSYPSLCPFNTKIMDGFINRMVSDYGNRKVKRAIPETNLDAMRSSYILSKIK